MTSINVALPVVTPTMFIHGEQDHDVHITQAEEIHMGLRRRGIEAVLVRYPREGHGLREPRHQLDSRRRTLAYLDKFLMPVKGSRCGRRQRQEALGRRR